MQQRTQDPAERFLVSAIAGFVRILLTPVYYAIRSDMGVQYSAFYPIAISLIVYGVAAKLLALGSEVDGSIAALYVLLVMVGYIRNTLQAKRRRVVRDWSVHSWSTGRTLLEPIAILICRRLYRIWGKENTFVRRLVQTVVSMDFLHYIAEPVMLLVVAAALASIGSFVSIYSGILAIALVFVRYDAQLRLYLRAHELADAKLFERSFMSEFEGPAALAGATTTVAQIPPTPMGRPATEERSVFKRLSPELQMLLMRDRVAQP